MEQKITVKNIMSFIQGHSNYYKDLFFGSPEYIKEQVLYRLYMCKDTCVKNKKCSYCGCPPMKKAWVPTSCNKGEIFPDRMDKDEWEEYKKINNINVKDFTDDN